MKTRRHFLAAVLTASLTLAAGSACAAPPVVEIIAMPHPPVKMALAPLRGWLAQQGNKLQIREIDSESAAGMQRLQSAG